MSTIGIVNGTAFGLYLGFSSNDLLGYATSCSISISHSPRKTTTSTSGGWQSRMVGDRDWEVSCDGLVSMELAGDKRNFAEIFQNYIQNRITVQIRFKTSVTGDYYYQGMAIVTGLTLDAPNEESTTYSISCVAAGPLEQLTV